MAHPWRHRVAAMWQTLRGERDQALPHYTAILDQEPADWSALHFVVQHLRRVGRDADALEAAQRAIGTEPDHFLALQTAACLSVKLGRYADAKEYAERSLEALPSIRSGSMPILDRLYLIAYRLARLLRRPKAMTSSSPEVPSSATERSLEDWKRWASGYLAWHAATTSGGGTDAGE